MQLPLPGLPSKSPQPVWRVWSGSTAAAVLWLPTRRKTLAGWKHQLRAWCREMHLGATGRSAVAVYEVLAFDFHNPDTGRCDPSYEGIAWKTGYSRRTIASALVWLRERRIISWERRCEGVRDEEGRFSLRQLTNAYRLLPPTQWLGWRDRTPPAPPGDTWGATPPIADPVESVVAALLADRPVEAAQVAVDDPLANALVGLDRAIRERDSGVQPLHCISTPELDNTGPPADASLEERKRHWLQRLAAPDPGG